MDALLALSFMRDVTRDLKNEIKQLRRTVQQRDHRISELHDLKFDLTSQLEQSQRDYRTIQGELEAVLREKETHIAKLKAENDQLLRLLNERAVTSP